MRTVRAKLRQLQQTEIIQPDLAWAHKDRARLMSQIGNTVVVPAKVSWSARTEELKYMFGNAGAWRLAKPVLAALLVAVLTTGGWIASVSASFNSLPGDRLWSIKRAAQNTEVAVKSLVASDSEKAQLHLGLAKNRTEDIKRAVAERTTAVDSDARSKAVSDLNVAAKDVAAAVKTASEAVNTQVQGVTKAELSAAIAIVTDVNKDVTEIVKNLQQAVPGANSVDTELTRAVVDAVKSVNESTLSTVEAVVTAQEKTSPDSPNSVTVKTLVNSKLSELAETTSGLEQAVKTIKQQPALTVEVGETHSSSSTIVAPVLTATSTASGTPSVGVTVPPVAAATVVQTNVIQAVEQKTVELQTSVGDIQKTIDDGHLREAVNKLKDLNQTAGATQQILVDSKNLPLVVSPSSTPSASTSSVKTSR